VRIHILLDGRDVPETSALDYVLPFEAFLAEVSERRLRRPHCLGRWRMNITMDRYEANWNMVDKGWHTHVLGEGEQYESASAAVEALRVKFPGTIDQDLPPFVIASERPFPSARSNDGDSVVFFNFRGDRSIEITRAFEEADFRQVRSRARAQGDLCRHAAVRRRPQAAQALPGRSAGHSRHHGRVVCQGRHHPVCLLGNAEVRARDLFLEWQPLEQVRR
jgi:bisphosphoglycerate-independent phosphoglycerate mutase (AlkP superfamily)